MNELHDSQKFGITGHVVIVDKDTGDILLNKFNAIHPQNMAMAIGRGLSNESNGNIYSMAIGNGGTKLNSSGQLVYMTPNTVGQSSVLYNQVYSEIVDAIGNTSTPVANSVTSSSSPSPAITTMVTVTMEIGPNEPNGQSITDNYTTPSDELTNTTAFEFNELGLFTKDGYMLTHLIFSPILKSANRSILINYAITISAS